MWRVIDQETWVDNIFGLVWTKEKVKVNKQFMILLVLVIPDISGLSSTRVTYFICIH